MDASLTAPIPGAASLGRLLDVVYERYQHDFRAYAPPSLERRLQQALVDLCCKDVDEMTRKVDADPRAFARLMHYLTVQVSDMFRDPGYFRAIREEVVPHLRTYPSLKVWVAGCSTGEELWSLAILFHEEGLLPRTQFYATDIHPESLRVAEAAVYGADRVAGFSRNYLAAGGTASLSDYYVCAYDAARFARDLPVKVVFADHSLATDSVFSEAHLVSCRNVLIYFDSVLQDRAVRLFADSLVHHGFLGLGSHETIRFSRHAALFEPFVRSQRIFRRR